MSGLDIENRLPRHLVLLLHECPNAPTHVDWLVAGDISGHTPLKSFRIADRLDAMHAGGRQAVVPLPDHRPRYLRCDGPLSRDRGVVRRLARGRLWTSSEPDVFRILWRTGSAAGQTQWIRLLPGSTKHALDVCCEGWNGRIH
jgi:hypothetical protein